MSLHPVNSPNSDPDSMAGNAPAAATIARLTLTDFRNYAYLNLTTSPGMVVLVGANGAGKTNILEAISLLAPGRGLRRVPLAECAREDGPGGFAVAAEVHGPDGSVRLGTGLVPGPEAGSLQRQCRIDGRTVGGPGQFADHLRLVWLTPTMDRLFSGPAGDRRRFLDRMDSTMDRDHPKRTAAYERAMAERNRLLVAGRADPAWLSGLEAQMAEWGTAIAAARLAAVAKVQDAIDAGTGGGAFPPARLDIEGMPEHDLAGLAAVDVEDRFRAALAAARGQDRAAGRTLAGPHRSDLAVVHGRTGVAARRCSTGEQKALVVSIVLAQARIVAGAFAGGAPILLLDEIAAHLDETRRIALFGALDTLGGQCWMTGTDRSLFAPLAASAQMCSVADGEVVIS